MNQMEFQKLYRKYENDVQNKMNEWLMTTMFPENEIILGFKEVLQRALRNTSPLLMNVSIDVFEGLLQNEDYEFNYFTIGKSVELVQSQSMEMLKMDADSFIQLQKGLLRMVQVFNEHIGPKKTELSRQIATQMSIANPGFKVPVGQA